MKNYKSNSKQGWATLEFALIMPFFVFLMAILMMLGDAYQTKLQMQYDNFAASKYVSEMVKKDDLSATVTSSKCELLASDLLKDRKYDSILCDINDNILTLNIVTSYKFIKVPFLEGLSKEIKTVSYSFVY